jgi:hypothetical protein
MLPARVKMKHGGASLSGNFAVDLPLLNELPDLHASRRRHWCA